LDKYDINQKIIKTLADLESRTILFSIKQKARLAEDISKKKKIPLSTVYKKLGELQELALVKIERIELSK
ncbi:MAG: ArsR family transcriptional regulator, partial [Nitrosopumilus sp.]|nr:ArsR family transcriptional regulator [Nitrosopumilus sp.]